MLYYFIPCVFLSFLSCRCLIADEVSPFFYRFKVVSSEIVPVQAASMEGKVMEHVVHIKEMSN